MKKQQFVAALFILIFVACSHNSFVPPANINVLEHELSSNASWEFSPVNIGGVSWRVALVDTAMKEAFHIDMDMNRTSFFRIGDALIYFVSMDSGAVYKISVEKLQFMQSNSSQNMEIYYEPFTGTPVLFTKRKY